MLCPRSQGRKLKPPRGTLYNRIWKLLQYCKIFHLITILDCYMMAMKKGESKISQNTASSMVFFVNFFLSWFEYTLFSHMYSILQAFLMKNLMWYVHQLPNLFVLGLLFYPRKNCRQPRKFREIFFLSLLSIYWHRFLLKSLGHHQMWTLLPPPSPG